MTANKRAAVTLHEHRSIHKVSNMAIGGVPIDSDHGAEVKVREATGSDATSSGTSGTFGLSRFPIGLIGLDDDDTVVGAR
jgi:hypothetical protein